MNWEKRLNDLRSILTSPNLQHISCTICIWAEPKFWLCWMQLRNSNKQHCVKFVQKRSFFWSGFSRIRTGYGEIRIISPYSVRMQENKDQKKLRIWTLFTQCAITRPAFTCSKSMETLEQFVKSFQILQLRHQNNVNAFTVVSLFSILSIFHTLFWIFYCGYWISKCQMGQYAVKTFKNWYWSVDATRTIFFKILFIKYLCLLDWQDTFGWTDNLSTVEKMKFSVENFFSKCGRSFLWIWSYLLKKSLMKNFIFCEVKNVSSF